MSDYRELGRERRAALDQGYTPALDPADRVVLVPPAIPLPPPVGADAEPGDLYGPPQ